MLFKTFQIFCIKAFAVSAHQVVNFSLIGNGHADYDVISHIILKRHVLQCIFACEIIVPQGCDKMFISYKVPYPVKVVCAVNCFLDCKVYPNVNRECLSSFIAHSSSVSLFLKLQGKFRSYKV